MQQREVTQRSRRRSKARASTSPDPLAAAGHTLDRLAAEVARALDRLRPPADGPRGLARAIGADVSVCQRVLSGVRSRGSASERLAEWPGTSGLISFTALLEAAIGARSGGSQLSLAVREYERLIGTLARSHAAAVRRLRTLERHAESAQHAGHPPADRQASTPTRRGLHRATSDLLGSSVDATTFVCMVRPIPGREDLMEGCSAIARLGLRASTSGVCVTSQNTQLRQVAGDLAGEVRWTPLGSPLSPGGRDGLLEEFSSTPMPLTSVDSGDGMIRQMVQPDVSGHGPRGVDVVLARHWSPDSNPQYTPSPSWSQILRTRQPCKRMVMDVYLHRSMVTAAPPSVGAYFWHPALPSDPRKNWHDRLPGAPAVTLLNPADPAPTPAWPRQAALTRRLMELSGFAPDEFVGFRCEEEYPIWGAAYYMTFDLRPVARS